MKKKESTGHVINRSGLPARYPTQAHKPELWEALGLAVATFGFLEEVLLRAIFAHTLTTPYDESEVEAAYEAWVPKITRSLSDPLGSLIGTYGKALREHPDANVVGLSALLVDLRKACKVRNAICHGSWRLPDSDGLSVPFFVNTKGEVF